jgi:hypothetical protein
MQADHDPIGMSDKEHALYELRTHGVLVSVHPALWLAVRAGMGVEGAEVWESGQRVA